MRRNNTKVRSVPGLGARLKIVALGDSLTVGESDPVLYSNVDVTYPSHLAALVRSHLDSHRSAMKLTVVNKGICGELTSGMLKRFPRDVIAEKADHVIILGGTNDISWSMSPLIIADNLAMMYDSALGEGIGPVACSVPSILGFDELISPRLRLNRMIRLNASKRGIAFVDLFAATSNPETNRLSEQYSADGLHLNGQGYKRMVSAYSTTGLDHYWKDPRTQLSDNSVAGHQNPTGSRRALSHGQCVIVLD